MKVATIFIGLSLALTACTNPDGSTNNTETGGVLGAGTGAALGGILGNVFGHSAGSTAAGALLGGLGGYFAGSYIGQQLDDRDRTLATAQSTYVLDEPAPAPQPGHAVVIRHARPRHWVSNHSTSSGSATLERVATTDAGQECRTVRELAVIHGQEIVQHTNYCQTATGGWKAESA
jgi:surface antigen